MITDFTKIDKEKIKKLIGINPDSRRYFFRRADSTWLNWLWENNFFDVIKEKSLDLDKYGYVTPELDYLVKAAEEKPKEVVDIMLTVPINIETFNPEVADRFLWICGELPQEQLARIVPKIKEENWIQLMSRYAHSAFEYKKMVDTLSKSKDYATLLILSEMILTIRKKEEISKTANGFGTDNPFYLNDIDQTEIFKILANTDESYYEKTLSIVSSTMKNIVLLGKDEAEDDLFDVGELFYLYDVDFFSLKVDDKKNFSYRDDVRNLAATLKELIKKTIGVKCEDKVYVERIFNTYINSLPFSQSMWRLRLFTVSLCPETFKTNIKEYLFEIFDEKKWSLLISGAEYEWLLKKTFSTLSDTDKQDYILRIFEFFGDDKKESFYKKHGYRLLSCIDTYLIKDQKEQVEVAFKRKLNSEYVPEPSIIGPTFASVIHSQAPIDQIFLNTMSISDIVSKLKNEWSPLNIIKGDKKQDFHNPINAEGMGSELQKNIASRFEEYVKSATLFFNRDELHPQYTYAFLQGAYDVIKAENFKPGVTDIGGILQLFELIIISGKEKSFDTKKINEFSNDGWIANWSWVHNTMTDVLKVVIGENKKVPLVDFDKNKKLLLNTISYLLTYPDPVIEDNTRENGGDPFTTAINSVRGRAFQALTLFVYQDGLIFPKEAESKISKEVKDIYEILLKSEDTYAIMFMFGYFLPTFYYRDKIWIRGLLSTIFPYESKKDLYVASWEGYLSTSLYREMFDELQPYYVQAIKNKIDKPKRRYFKEVNEGVATHIALAYIHFEDITFESEIFKLFWTTPNTEQHMEFVSFIGRYAFARDNGLNFRETNNIPVKKLKELWDWILINCNESETFSCFGFWMNDETKEFDIKWLTKNISKSLEKSGGELDWDYGMIKLLPKFATEAPENTLRILQMYLTGPSVGDNLLHTSVYIESDLFDVFKILYLNPISKVGTGVLINKLLPLLDGQFWKLRKILNNNS